MEIEWLQVGVGIFIGLMIGNANFRKSVMNALKMKPPEDKK